MLPHKKNPIWLLLLAAGIIFLAIGIYAFIDPLDSYFNALLAFIALPYFIGVWLLLVGILKTMAAPALRHSVRGWPLILLVGVLCDLFGGLLLFSPLPKANAVTIIIGVFGLVMGSLYTIDAFRYRNMTDTLDMLL